MYGSSVGGARLLTRQGARLKMVTSADPGGPPNLKAAIVESHVRIWQKLHMQYPLLAVNLIPSEGSRGSQRQTGHSDANLRSQNL